MSIFKFLDGVTEDTTSAEFAIDTSVYPVLYIQISIGTAATVKVEGQIQGIEDWATISGDSNITANGMYIQTTAPVMRVVSTGVNGPLKVWGVGVPNRVFV